MGARIEITDLEMKVILAGRNGFLRVSLGREELGPGHTGLSRSGRRFE